MLALGSAGGLHGHLGPGTVLVPDDFLALTTYPTFHDTTDGYRMAAIDPTWRARVVEAWREATATPFVDGGTYAMVRGPRFETPAEIRLLATFADLVGMTWPAECILAGEAGLPYAVICKVDNLANGVEGHAASVEEYRERTAADAERLAADLVAVVDRLLAAHLSPDAAAGARNGPRHLPSSASNSEDEEHLLVGRQRPEVVGDQPSSASAAAADRRHGRQERVAGVRGLVEHAALDARAPSAALERGECRLQLGDRGR